MDHKNAPPNENVQVFVRCRPLNEREIEENQRIIVKCCEKQKQVTVNSKNNKHNKTFYFDSVFDLNATQSDVFASSIKPIVKEVLNGYNCTIFVYGTTGTGKTYTMEGANESAEENNYFGLSRFGVHQDAGIICRSVDQIFSSFDKGNTEHFVSVSHLQVYNEDLYDLLNPKNILKISEDAKSGAVQVLNLEEIAVQSPQDIFKILQNRDERKTAETALNKCSSRSHSIFILTIRIREPTDSGDDLIKIGKLNFVDLAGSESISRSGTDRDYIRKQEASNINKSLLTLGRVITALAENASHIPYRESKLTRLLRDSLGGRTKTCIIATISPCHRNQEETLSTLEYASRAKHIKNRPEVNQKVNKREELLQITEKILELRQQLEASYAQNGVPLNLYQDLETKLKECEENVSNLSKAVIDKDMCLNALQQRYEDQCHENIYIKKKLDDTLAALDEKECQLALTQTQLEEHKHLADVYESAEEALYINSKTLLQVLLNCMKHVERLHSKLDSKGIIEEKNNMLICQFVKEMLKCLENENSNILAFLDGMDGWMDEFQAKTDKLSREKVSRMGGLKIEVENLKNYVCQKLGNFSTMASQKCQALSDAVACFENTNNEFCKKVVDGLKKHHSDIVSKVECFEKDGHTYVQKIRGDLGNCAEDMENAHAQVKEFVSSQQETFNNMGSMVGEFNHRQKNIFLKQVDTLAKFQHHQESQIKQFKSDIISTVSQVLGAYEEKWQMEMDALKQTTAGIDVGEFDCFCTEFNESVTKGKACADSLYKEHDIQKARLGCTIEKSIETLTSYENCIHTHTGSTKEVLNAQNCVINDNISNQVEYVSEFCKNHVGDIRSYEEECSSTVQNAHSETVRMQSELVADLCNKDCFDQYFETVNPLVAQNTITSKKFRQSYIAKSVKIQDSLKDLRLDSYKPTGLTPCKTHFSYPQDICKSRPRDAILEEFRHKRINAPSESIESITIFDQEENLSPADLCALDQPPSMDEPKFKETSRLMKSSNFDNPSIQTTKLNPDKLPIVLACNEKDLSDCSAAIFPPTLSRPYKKSDATKTGNFGSLKDITNHC